MPIARAQSVSEAYRVARERPHDRTASSMLESLVREYVEVARREGWTAEKALVELKRRLREAGGKIGHSADTSPEARKADRLYEQVVGWCIQHYYTAPPAK